MARRIAGLETARAAVHICLDAFEICAVDRPILEHAYDLAGMDFEDDLQIACAHFASLDAIVTRDTTGFSGSSISIATPGELLARL